jgi:hypothetical protein
VDFEFLMEKNQVLREELELSNETKKELSEKYEDTSIYVSTLEHKLNEFLVGECENNPAGTPCSLMNRNE